MNGSFRNNDEFWLVSREEMELRFGLHPSFTKLWMEAKEEERMPFILLGKTSPKFMLPDVWEWLKRKFGHGYPQAEQPQAGPKTMSKAG